MSRTTFKQHIKQPYFSQPIKSMLDRTLLSNYLARPHRHTDITFFSTVSLETNYLGKY